MNGSDVLLQMVDITKIFPGVKALDKMSLTVRKSTVHALMGENGAGKSTLMKILSGLYSRDAGEIYLDGKPLDTSSVHSVLNQGVSMIYQELNPISRMTVAENIFCGREQCKAGGLWVERRKMNREAQELLDYLDIKAVHPQQIVRNLSIAQKQLLEVAKAFANNSKLIVLDEPTSSLTEEECQVLFRIINRLKKEGLSFIYITHKMDEIFVVADEVTVMRDGQYVGTRKSEETSKDEIIEMMVGREITQIYPKEQVPIGDVKMSVSDLCIEGLLDHVSFDLRQGEILGFAGLIGAGRSETMEAIFGVRKKDAGTISINGQPVNIKSPKNAIANGLAFLTEDRRGTGCFLKSSVFSNVMLLVWDKFRKWFGLLPRKAKAACQEQIDLYSIKCAGQNQVVRDLSGGNQQKLLIARWMMTKPDILILDEPTRGIDVATKHDIYVEMEALVKEGKSIIMVSSELPEILGMSDRIVVMCEGRVTGILDREDADQETILRYAAGIVDQNKEEV